MSIIEFDYGLLDSVIRDANRMGGGFGCYEEYRSDIKWSLHDSIAEWNLAGKEPMGHTYIEDARSKAESKRKQLSNAKSDWKTVSANLSSFKSFVEERDNAVATEFETTSNAYTNYTGLGGLFTWLGDAFFGVVGVDFANSNSFTRAIADWGKRTADDLDSIKRDVLDWFKHGDGRYILNIAGSVLLTAAAIVGVVIAIAGAPFTGGLTLFAAVAWLGVVASTGLAVISTINTVYTVKENKHALAIDGDPARARFHGDVESYSDHVSKTVYSSPEEYQKYSKRARAIDTAEGVCTVVSITTGLATTFGSTTVSTVDKAGNVTEVKKFDFHPSNVKKNVLKTFGFTTDSKLVDVSVASDSSTTIVSTGGEASGMSVTAEYSANTGSIEHGIERSTSKQVLTASDGKMKVKYKQKMFTQNKTIYTNEYSKTVISNGPTTMYHKEVNSIAVTHKHSLDYSKAIMSTNKAEKISAIEKGTSNTVNTLKKTKKIIDGAEKITKDLKSNEPRTTAETIKRLVTKNNFVSNFDKYVYDLDTSKDATWKDHLKGIGGSNARKGYSSYDLIVGNAS